MRPKVAYGGLGACPQFGKGRLTAGQWLTQQRVEHARRLLEATDWPVDRVAGEAGFGTAASLRQHMAAATGVSPMAYRQTLRAQDGRGRQAAV